MGISRGRIFTHNTAVLFCMHSLCKTSKLTPNTLFSAVPVDVKKQWGPGYKVYTRKFSKMVWNFLKRWAFFQKWVFLQEEVFTFFYTGLLTQYFLELTPRCMPSAPSNQPLLKKRKFIGTILGLGLSIASPSPKFYADAFALHHTHRS